MEGLKFNPSVSFIAFNYSRETPATETGCKLVQQDPIAAKASVMEHLPDMTHTGLPG